MVTNKLFSNFFQKLTVLTLCGGVFCSSLSSPSWGMKEGMKEDEKDKQIVPKHTTPSKEQLFDLAPQEIWNKILGHLPLPQQAQFILVAKDGRKLFSCVHINIRWNDFPQTLQKHFSSLCTLINPQILDLSGTSITDQELSYVSKLKNLRSLDLHDCDKITDNGFKHISGLTNLISLNMDNCYGLTAHKFKYLSKLTNLTKLNGMEECTTDKALNYISRLKKLAELNLMGCHITDKGLKYLSGFTNLTNVSLYLCDKITDNGLIHFSGLSNLKELDIGQTNITDKGLKHLSGL